MGRKKPGLFFTMTGDGFEQPIIDVTPPAFAIDVRSSVLHRLLQVHLREAEQHNKAPAFLQSLMIGFMMRRTRRGNSAEGQVVLPELVPRLEQVTAEQDVGKVLGLDVLNAMRVSGSTFHAACLEQRERRIRVCSPE